MAAVTLAGALVPALAAETAPQVPSMAATATTPVTTMRLKCVVSQTTLLDKGVYKGRRVILQESCMFPGESLSKCLLMLAVVYMHCLGTRGFIGNV